ncbi:hypothetical protein CLAFUW4_05461 [Fulvia fulva]|uniref:Uncharacterized protein n=1 Tax=Passalora fulva TaxID=5499 RepID=A0A9Q8P9I3_PASFU|nr:uncharacterized protein CLAFUR5_05604 [Fulvia fulva]KAK4623899.1 hypothetical protein CLAFUR4_05455 [Fulvia fulva]KAK4625150.1 hypothetical protein CLAFUR0_05463 [Fulvia fulva]UJO18193.1 hypothetical protein CLAFUR5_05604 [Fulvia fulva]WPV14551.1 hypothetical protein CLAFUW4_05461 [Fulvia fulva]WPV30340.1 hypothetical protein CLAFUW7_05459 [Fulvia fulva]
MLTTLSILPALALFTTSISAAPIQRAEASVNTALYNYPLQAPSAGQPFTSLQLRIGQPYIDGTGCEAVVIREALLGELLSIVDVYRCVEDGSLKGAFISFSSFPDEAKRLRATETFAEAYPMIEWFLDDDISAVR